MSDDGKVVKLAIPEGPEPDESVIRILEEMVDLAKRGVLRGVAAAYVSTMPGYASVVSRVRVAADGTPIASLIGGVAILQQEMIAAFVEEHEYVEVPPG